MPPRPFLRDRPVDEALSLSQLQGGGLPLRAQRRIHELLHGETGTAAQGHAVFTSMLSPAETLVARATGLTPVSQVMGACLYHVGGMWNTYVSAGEITQLSHAYHEARNLALSRMAQEAQQLQCHAVVGVKLTQRTPEWGAGTLEVTATGTAVRLAGEPLPPFPALAMLEADELWKLHVAGYWPVGIALGNCFWFDPHCDCVRDGSWVSQPLPAHDNANHQVAFHAQERFRRSTDRFGAAGVVGVKVHRIAHDHVEDGHCRFFAEMLLLGTAVVRHGKEVKGEKPQLVFDVRDKTFSAAARGHR